MLLGDWFGSFAGYIGIMAWDRFIVGAYIIFLGKIIFVGDSV